MRKIVWNAIDYINDPIDPKTKNSLKGPVIYLFGRDIDNPQKRLKIRIPNFEPYFIAVAGTPEFFKELKKNPAPKIKSPLFKGSFYKKFITYYPFQVRMIRMALEKSKSHETTYEADVLFCNRFLIDNELLSAFTVEKEPRGLRITPLKEDLSSNLRIIYLDVEVWARGQPKKKDPINVVTLFDTYTKKYFCFYLLNYQTSKKQGFLKEDIEPKLNLLKQHDEDLLGKKRSYEVEYFPCESQKELLLKVVNHLSKILNPDIIAGFNVDFDLVTLYRACKANGILPELLSPLFKEARAKAVSSPRVRHKKVGDMLLDSVAIKIKGRNIIDLQEAYFTIHLSGSDEMNLDYICQKELKKGKLEMPAGLFITWLTDPQRMIEYNLRDVELCKDLDEHLQLITFCDEKRKVVGCELQDALSPKKLLDIFLLRKARKMGIFLPTARIRSEKYKGAVVIDPIKGLYIWLVCMDFRQLYPTIIITFNIDPETFRNFKYPDPQVEQFKLDDNHYFFKSPKGLIPSMVEDLLILRDEKRKLESEALAAGNMEAYNLYKLQEDAVKVLANATYGVLAYRFRKAAKETVESITLVARTILNFSKEVIEQNGRKVIYGDSVRENTPIVIQRNGKLKVIPIKEVQVGDQTITERGWTTVLNVISKKVKKRMYRIETYDGISEVTKDHSLMNSEYLPEKPGNINKGEILGSFKYDLKTIEEKLDKDEAWLLGYFVADGTAGDYRKTCKKVSIHFDSQDISLLEKAKRILGKIGFGSTIDSFPSNITEGGMVHRLNILNPIRSNALEYFMNCYNKEHKKIIPEIILNSSRDSIENFLEGYLDGDGSNKNKEKIWEATDTDLVIFGLHILAKKIGLKSRYMVYVGQRKTKEYLRKIRFVRNINDKRLHEDFMVKKITNLGIKEEIVYDLETENHHFSAGGILLHNTDSLFWIPNSTNIEDILKEMELIQGKVETAITSLLANRFNFREPNHQFKFEPDMIFDSFLILEKKKRYAGHYVWEKRKKETDDYKIMGLESKRSDISSFGRGIQIEVLHKILKHESREIIIEWLNSILNQIKAQKYNVIGIPSAISKELEKYVVNSVQKRAVEYSNEHLGANFQPGTKPKRIYIKKTLDSQKYPFTDVIAIDGFSEVPNELIVDYPRMLDTIKKKIVKLLDIVNIQWNDLSLDGDLTLTQKKMTFDSDRYRVLARDDFTCDICKKQFPIDYLIVTIKEKGLEKTIENSITLCKECRKGKRRNVESSTVSLDSFLKKES